MEMKAIELSTLIGDPGDLITVLEHTVPGDGGGGTFMWSTFPDPTLMPDEDGGIVFGTTPSGRWIRQWSGYVNVRWFGARGDGVGYDPIIGDTDAIHIGDTDRIQKAINFCAAYQSGGIVGGTVFFPPGIYVVSAPTKKAPFKLILKSKVRLLGSGSSSELRSRLHQNYTSRTLSSEDSVTLEDVTIQSLKIDGRETDQEHDGTNVQRAAIFVYTSTNFEVIDCIFHNTADAIRLFQSSKGEFNIGSYIAGNEIFGNSIDIGRECMIIAGARESIVENNYIHDCPFATGIKMEGALPAVEFSNLVRGNVCMRIGTGVTLKGGCIVTGNIIEATLGVAAMVGHHCHFISNRIIGGVQVGILLVSNDDTIENVIITNNTISNIRFAGEACDGIVGLFNSGFMPQNVTISNNIIENDPTGTNPFSGIRFEFVGSDITVDNNQIYGADNGVFVSPHQRNTIERVRATNNTITLKNNGNGVLLTAVSVKNANLRHVVVSGNIVAKAAASITGTTGILIKGDPDRVILTSNDTSDTDTPFNTVIANGAGPPTNLVTANNIGF
jgi:Pectate lyase superfamily protein